MKWYISDGAAAQEGWHEEVCRQPFGDERKPVCYEESASGGKGIKRPVWNFDLDPSKVVISTRYASFDGEGLSELLRKQYHLEMEMSGADYVTAITAVGDSKAGLERLRAALLAIDKEGFPSGKMELQGREGAGSDCVYAIEAKTRCSIREAIDGKLREYLSGKAQGKYPGNLSISIRRVSL